MLRSCLSALALAMLLSIGSGDAVDHHGKKKDKKAASETAVLALSLEDRRAIKKAIFDYFHGIGTADKERLLGVFAEKDASMIGVMRRDGRDQVRAWKDFTQIIDRWASVDNPPGDARDGAILSIQAVDGRLATVLFRYTDQYYDAMTLAKINGTWTIIAKAFVLQ